jgi:rRNA processing protein Gar1
MLTACCCHPSQIPYFNAPIFLENKTQIGKVEEILGRIDSVVRVLAFFGARCHSMIDGGQQAHGSTM